MILGNVHLANWCNGDAVDRWDLQVVLLTYENPTFDDFGEMPSAFFQCLSRCPDTSQIRHFCVVRLLVVDHLVVRDFECSLNIFLNHDNAPI